MIRIETSHPKILSELEDVAKLFCPQYDRSAENCHVFYVDFNPHDYTKPIKISRNNSVVFSSEFDPNYQPKIRPISKQFEWEAKKTLFKTLQGVYNVQIPYGCLTGIRPTKLATSLLKHGISRDFAAEILQKDYYISPQKIDLILSITDVQQPLLSTNQSEVDFYVHIPFCPSRCRYCSFISLDYQRNAHLLPEYLQTLSLEIKRTLARLKATGKTIRSVYIGGGTPTVLTPQQLAELMDILPSAPEFTVEAGRPETITPQKLEAIRGKATRISVNPQTFSNDVLKAIGRAHTADDVFTAYDLALKHGFIVNMDIIAGLTTDTLNGFKNTVNTILTLKPHNVTVHTLSVKRTSSTDIAEALECSSVGDMVDYAHTTLAGEYNPYYMYRQKYQTQNLENTGYAIKSTECLFNIDTMEENVSVIACGAGAITKVYYPEENRIARIPNVKNIEQYIQRIHEMIDKKINILT